MYEQKFTKNKTWLVKHKLTLDPDKTEALFMRGKRKVRGRVRKREGECSTVFVIDGHTIVSKKKN